MRRRLPPLEQIEAFIEAAKGPSFRAAAERCAISPAAFSRRLQAFAAALGVPLFERSAGRIRLTEAGRQRFAEFEPSYNALRRAAAALPRDRGTPKEVRLALSHSLAVGWLIPRLDGLRAACPDIEIVLRSERSAAGVRSGDADLGFCFSDIDVRGLITGPTVPVLVTPVAAPEFAAAFRSGRRRLADERLLTVAEPAGIWDWWGRAAGRDEVLTAGASFEILHAMYEAAAHGFGVAMGASPTVAPFLLSGRLVTLGLPAIPFPGGYRLVTAAEQRRRPEVVAVWRWLAAEAQLPAGIAKV
jgi:DNA-binding transcriptional LysR family regulator